MRRFILIVTLAVGCSSSKPDAPSKPVAPVNKTPEQWKKDAIGMSSSDLRAALGEPDMIQNDDMGFLRRQLQGRTKNPRRQFWIYEKKFPYEFHLTIEEGKCIEVRYDEPHPRTRVRPSDDPDEEDKPRERDTKKR
jgi:hypothetical protein